MLETETDEMADPRLVTQIPFLLAAIDVCGRHHPNLAPSETEAIRTEVGQVPTIDLIIEDGMRREHFGRLTQRSIFP